MIRFQLVVIFLTITTGPFDLFNRISFGVHARFFEYELPNRTITICPSYSLIALECPQIPSLLDQHSWRPATPKYLISIDYIRSFPLRLGFDPRSCQPDLAHACNNYDLRYINTLCNGKPQCSDISAYQIRERSLCAFKAVTEIGFHCVPTWNLPEIQTKCDICQNTSLTSDYGFIYSRNYPLKTTRMSCFTTIYARPNHKIVLYFVDGELNHDQLRIESVTANGMSILNVSLNGNLSTQRLAASIYQMKITFLPSQVYSYHPTYYLLYFYMIPICSITEPCLPSPPSILTTQPIYPIRTTSRTRIQSVGWTKIPNIWIVIPVILAYILLLLLIVVLALLLQRRRKQQKPPIPSRYLNASGTSSRAHLVTPLPPVPPNPGINYDTRSSRRRQASVSQSIHHPFPASSFIQSSDHYYRSSRSDFDLHQNNPNGIDYRFHSSIPSRTRPRTLNDTYRGYDTVDRESYNLDRTNYRRSIPKSFSDCDLCKRRVIDEEYLNKYDDNWRLENSSERPNEPRTYRDKIKERVRERLTIRQLPDTDTLPPSSTTVEYSTVLPRHQRIASESNQSVRHLPFEYIPNEKSTSERLTTTNNPHPTETGSTIYTTKFYDQDNLERRFQDPREIQEMSMRVNEQQNYNQYPYHHQQQRYFNENTSEI
ncbi:unnamed protein product [Adineta ricciae]|uniref:CUB domain-containing protein n=2 Tax=Adineta ricciae TaxID=249248 RepID=A0A814H6G5_ADIRI|nr:unnamed protein product [Adineta ricciae]